MMLLVLIIVVNCIIAAVCLPRSGALFSELDESDPFSSESVARLAAEENLLTEELRHQLDRIAPVDDDYMFMPDAPRPPESDSEPAIPHSMPSEGANDVDAAIDAVVNAAVKNSALASPGYGNKHQTEVARNRAISKMKKVVKDILNKIMPTAHMIGTAVVDDVHPA